MCLAIPGKIETITGDDPLLREAMVDFGGVKRRISLAATPEAGCGNWILAHAGLAIGIIDEEEARQLVDDLNTLTGHDGPADLGAGESSHEADR